MFHKSCDVLSYLQSRMNRKHFKSEILPSLDAIILSPGPGTPEREADFGFNSRLIREANIPIFGICLGHQGIGTSFGARIIHTPNIKHGQICQVHHRDIGVLKGLPQGFDSVRYNSLVLDINSMYLCPVLIGLLLMKLTHNRCAIQSRGHSLDVRSRRPRQKGADGSSTPRASNLRRTVASRKCLLRLRQTNSSELPRCCPQFLGDQ